MKLPATLMNHVSVSCYRVIACELITRSSSSMSNGSVALGVVSARHAQGTWTSEDVIIVIACVCELLINLSPTPEVRKKLQVAAGNILASGKEAINEEQFTRRHKTCVRAALTYRHSSEANTSNFRGRRGQAGDIRLCYNTCYVFPYIINTTYISDTSCH